MALDYINEVRGRYEAWWKNQNDEPLFYIIYPKDGANFDPVAKDWMAPRIRGDWSNWQQEFVLGQALELSYKSGEDHYIEEAIDFLEHYADVTGHAAEGYSFLNPAFGPGSLSAFITGFSEFKDSTIWLEMDPPMEWDAILEIDENTRHPYADAALEVTRRAKDRLKERFVFGTPDLGGVCDILSSLRGVNNLLLDTLTQPDEVHQALDVLEKLWFKFYEEFSAIVNPDNHGCYSTVMRWLSAKPVNTGICDFSAMIGPDMFQEYALPPLERDVEYFDGRVIYHLDGPGEIPHVDTICGIEKLTAIQWVPGAGNPGTTDPYWDDLYRRILDHGKKIALGGASKDMDELRAFFKRFPAREFFAPFTVQSEKQAEELLRLKDEV
ncbi:MAG: hypothetical protein ACLFUS_11930 [Candidatus Sumerlaeia bacterium]